MLDFIGHFLVFSSPIVEPNLDLLFSKSEGVR